LAQLLPGNFYNPGRFWLFTGLIPPWKNLSPNNKRNLHNFARCLGKFHPLRQRVALYKKPRMARDRPELAEGLSGFLCFFQQSQL